VRGDWLVLESGLHGFNTVALTACAEDRTGLLHALCALLLQVDVSLTVDGAAVSRIEDFAFVSFVVRLWCGDPREALQALGRRLADRPVAPDGQQIVVSNRRCIVIRGPDRPGFLLDVTAVLLKHDVNIVALNTKTWMMCPEGLDGGLPVWTLRFDVELTVDAVRNFAALIQELLALDTLCNVLATD
jgi:glycine cleavage system regulatory protein